LFPLILTLSTKYSPLPFGWIVFCIWRIFPWGFDGRFILPSPLATFFIFTPFLGLEKKKKIHGI
jgi:hypothetical protein